MLVVDKICKAYRREKVLEGISFEAEPGTILGICGSNGAGKTT
ncbi:MAG: ATP-binding cassette domain-containing protein [Ruminococcaceae bacterium]|nr:ATP-binding cassette domain-containing protein [Oscillospiraceae bacterium]